MIYWTEQDCNKQGSDNRYDKECKRDLEEARKEEHSNMTNEQIEAYCEIGHSYVKELKEEYLRLEKEMKDKEIMKRVYNQ